MLPEEEVFAQEVDELINTVLARYQDAISRIDFINGYTRMSRIVGGRLDTAIETAKRIIDEQSQNPEY